MARKHAPSYLHHKASGQAAVKINGRFVYLGRFGSQESKRKYQRMISEWQAAQEQISPTTHVEGDLLVAEIIVAYLRWAETVYVKDYKQTDELCSLKAASARLTAEVPYSVRSSSYYPLCSGPFLTCLIKSL